MKVDIKKIDNKVHVFVEVLHYDDYNCRKIIRLQESDVRSYIESNSKVEIGACIKNDTIYNLSTKTNGEWIYESLEIIKPKIQSRQNKNKRNYKKSQKNLDNIPKDVIIKETLNEE